MPTFTEEYRTWDKSEWSDGPWRQEPDKAVWVDEATGLDCLIVRGPSSALCGYVGVPADHPWHGQGYDDHYDIEVHGGLTFAGACHPSEDHSTGICHIPQSDRPDNVWWFGFDCCHAWDRAPEREFRDRQRYEAKVKGDTEGMRLWSYRDHDSTYRSIDYVIREVEGLARQLAAVAGGDDGAE